MALAAQRRAEVRVEHRDGYVALMHGVPFGSCLVDWEDAHHFLSFARSSSKKFCTTTRVGVPAMSPQLLSRTMRNR